MKPVALVRVGLWAGALAAALLLPGDARAQLEGRWKLDPAATARGAEAYARNCGFCHGGDGRGTERAPDLLRSELVNRDEKGELVAELLAHGRADKGMPAFPELAGSGPDIASFLHDRIQAVMNRMAYRISDTLVGDAKAGRAYFKRSCSSCHSPTGDLKGIGTRLTPDVLQAQIAYPGPNVISYIGFDMRPVKRPPVRVAVTLPDGRTVSGTAVFIGEFDVALRDTDGTYHSFARDPGVAVAIDDPLAEHRRLMSRYTDADLHNLVAYLMGLK